MNSASEPQFSASSSDRLQATPFWIPEPRQTVRCLACSRECRIPPGGTGFCRARVNRDGRLVRPYENLLSALQNDPVEKKPLYHFLPGSRVLSAGGWGCNFICPWCQNHPIAQNLPGEGKIRPTTPEELVAAAKTAGCPSLAFTFNEPTIAIEFVLKTFGLAKESGLRTVLVSNGSMGARGARALAPTLDAVNVDLKGFDAEKMRRVVSGELGAVLASIEAFRAEGVWTEVTTLVVPGFNDSPSELQSAARWLAGIGRCTVWHLSAFHPDYQYRSVRPTRPEELSNARRIGLEAGLHYVYVGNVPEEESTTRCCRCDAVVVERKSGRVSFAGDFRGVCPDCGADVPGVWT